MTDLSVVAIRMQQIRKNKKLSRQQIAEQLGTTYLQVYRMETGQTAIGADDVPRIADALGCSIASLYREARAS